MNSACVSLVCSVVQYRSNSQSIELTKPFCNLILLFSNNHITLPHTKDAKMAKALLSVGTGLFDG